MGKGWTLSGRASHHAERKKSQTASKVEFREMEILSVCALGSTTVEASIEVPHRAASASPEDVKLLKKNFFFLSLVIFCFFF